MTKRLSTTYFKPYILIPAILLATTRVVARLLVLSLVFQIAVFHLTRFIIYYLMSSKLFPFAYSLIALVSGRESFLSFVRVQHIPLQAFC